MQNVHFSPPQLAPLFGVNVSTVKRWIDRRMLPAEITSGGHRRVTREQLQLFLKRYPRMQMRSYVLNRFLQPREDYEKIWPKYYGLLQGLRPNAAGNIIDQLFLRQMPPLAIVESVITPTLRHIGAEWAAGRISIYDEHRMTFLIRTHLVRLQDLFPKPSGRRVALLTCVPDEHHEISLQMLGLVLQSKGWTIHNLGINTPAFEVLRAMKTLHPQLVCITKNFTKSGSLDYLNTIAAACRRQRVRLAYGGRGWSKLVRERAWPTPKIKYYPTLSAFAADT